MKLRVSEERIKKDLDKITAITASPGAGCTRLSYSQEDRQVRAYLQEMLQAYGLEVTVDGMGNIRALLATEENRKKPAVMVGSHIDTVPQGGKYDGLIGVLAALEVVRVVKEEGLVLDHPVEFVVFAEEEGSNFGTTMLGSKALTGRLQVEDLKKLKNKQGQSAYEVLVDFGLEADQIEKEVLREGELLAMLELHIEQGGVLDTKNLSLGLVEAIVGMRSYQVQIKGVSNHAGTTPMDLRRDPLLGAADLALALEKMAQDSPYGTTVATVGRMELSPNASNVIAGQVDLTVDIRDVEEDGMDFVVAAMKEKIKEIELARGLEIELSLLGQSPVVDLEEGLVDLLEDLVQEKGYSYQRMASGAVHDAAMLATQFPVAMIFVPSLGGISHSPQEETPMEDIIRGANLLLEAVLALARKKTTSF